MYWGSLLSKLVDFNAFKGVIKEQGAAAGAEKWTNKSRPERCYTTLLLKSSVCTCGRAPSSHRCPPRLHRILNTCKNTFPDSRNVLDFTFTFGCILRTYFISAVWFSMYKLPKIVF